MMHFFHSPEFGVAAFIFYYLFSAAAGAMLAPIAGKERSGYGYLYRFIQLLAANGHRFEQKLSGVVPELAASADPRVIKMPLSVKVINALHDLCFFAAGVLTGYLVWHGNILAAWLCCGLFGIMASVMQSFALNLYIDNLKTKGVL